MHTDSANENTQIEQNQELKPVFAGQEGYALTRAEMEQITAAKRNRLYGIMFSVSVCFLVISVVLMTGFKLNEGFLDANSRLGILMESLSVQEDNFSYPKINVRVNFKDEERSTLALPLSAPIDMEDINIREEFTQNKFVITLLGYSGNVPDGVELVSDSAIMDAVGVYRQNNDVVVEVYCRGRYDYELAVDNNLLTVSLKDMADDYAAAAVVWIPYDDKKRLALPEWRQILDQFAADNKVKLYIASDMCEEYTQADVIDFANRTGADMVLGVQVEQTLEHQSYLTGICNTSYFMPDYNSAHLSVIMTGTFAKVTQMNMHDFEEGGSDNPLVSEAAVPAAMVKISLTQEDMGSVEYEYKLNEKIAESLAGTMSSILENYINTEENRNEG